MRSAGWAVGLAVVFMSSEVWAWGGLVHREIAHHALGGLTGEARARLSPLSDRIVNAVMDADERVETDKEERPRHYCDLEELGASDPDVTTLQEPTPPPGAREGWPARMRARVGEIGARKVGVLPDAMPATYDALVSALKRRDDDATVRLAADLLHYLGDAHQPLHATRRYDGLAAFQKGVHAAFETDFPKACRKALPRGPAAGVQTDAAVADVAWDALLESHALASSVLAVDLGCSRRQGMRAACDGAPPEARAVVQRCDATWASIIRARAERAAARGRDLLARAVKDAARQRGP
jgi:hypothetical protein